MVGQWKRTGSYGTRTHRTMSHFECWKVQAEQWFDDNPYKPVIQAGPGRPARYTDEQIITRRNLQGNIKRWTVRQQQYLGEGMWAMAGKYGDRVSMANRELERMVVKVE